MNETFSEFNVPCRCIGVRYKHVGMIKDIVLA